MADYGSGSCENCGHFYEDEETGITYCELAEEPVLPEACSCIFFE